MANERWASDANFPAGSDPWSGEPTKVTPDAGEIAAGHVPGVPLPAETENWWKNRTDARLEAVEGASETFVMRPHLVRDDADVTEFDIFGAAEFTSGSATLAFAFPLRAGRTVIGFKLTAKGDVAADLTFGFAILNRGDVTEFNNDPDHADNVPAAYTTYEVDITAFDLNPATTYSVQEGDVLLFTPTTSAANITIASVTVLYA